MTWNHLHQKSLIIAAIVAVTGLVACHQTHAASATWTGAAANGLWADNNNWTAAYPNGTDETATFVTTVDTAIDVNANVTVGDILHGTPTGTGNGAGRITFSGAGSLTLNTSSGTASILGFQGAYDPSFWVGPYTIDVPLVLDVNTLNIGASVESVGQMTAATGRDVTVNAYIRDNQTYNTDNDFGNGILNVSTVGTYLTLEGVNAAGGPDVTVRLLAGRCDLKSTTSKMADIEIVGSVQTVPNDVVIGSLSIYSGKTWEVFTTTNLSTLRVAPDETVFIDTDGQLYMHHFNNLRSGFMRVSTGSSVTGFGTITTEPGGGHAPHVYIESGATLNPGTNGVTGIFHIGSATYNTTEVTLEPGAVMAFDLGGPVAGTNHDQVSVDGGTLTITDAVLDLSLAAAYDPTDMLFLAVANGGSILGTFAGLADGDTVELGLFDRSIYTATINYTGNAGAASLTGGNDIVLSGFTGTKIPEPATMALLTLGGLAILSRRQRA